jgi:hypothetical protein
MNKEFKKMQKLAGLITEAKAPSDQIDQIKSAIISLNKIRSYTWLGRTVTESVEATARLLEDLDLNNIENNLK